MLELSELEHSALTEIVNLSIGRAAGVLNKMIGQEVTLTVPRVTILEGTSVLKIDDTRFGESTTLVQQYFEGPVSGIANLVFPGRNNLELVRLMLGSELPTEQLVELEPDAFQELGNVILNSFLGTLGDELDVSISSLFPVFKKNIPPETMLGNLNNTQCSIILIHVDFRVQKVDISGFLVLVLTVNSLNAFHDLLVKYTDGVR